MIPHFCTVKHDPESGSFGDCLRAAVASVLNVDDARSVPHFNHDGCDRDTLYNRLDDWLTDHDCAPCYVAFPADLELSEVLDIIGGGVNRKLHYLLFGRSDTSGNHVVVCRGNKIVHDPAWSPERFTRPTDNCDWQVLIIAATRLPR